MASHEPEKIAVIGAGISGIAAAYYLSPTNHVVLFERESELGGHTNTRVVADPKYGELAVDTGFIVCNPKNYPLFYQLLHQWEVPLRNSDMSFGFYCERSRLNYMGPAIQDFLREPRNLLNRDFLRMIAEQRKFNRQIKQDLLKEQLTNLRLDDYIQRLQLSDYFVDHYLAPLIGAIWSSPDAGARDFPTATFATFFDNHGMLELHKRPQWQTIVGGSRTYLRRFEEKFRGEIRTSARIHTVTRTHHGATIEFEDGTAENFTKVVFATHADLTLKLLGDPDVHERELLGAWSYSRNHTVLHTDRRVMPPKEKLWASWNYRRRFSSDHHDPVSITYYMNRLQGLTSNEPLLVTLNPREGDIDPRKVYYATEYTHPIFTPHSVNTQAKILARNGVRNTYFCGAYLRYGFHEDGVWSARQSADAIVGNISPS